MFEAPICLPPISPGVIDARYLRNLLGTDTPVILDVGANDGSTTLSFLQCFPGARIYAFEPDPRASSKFIARVTDRRVEFFAMAVGASDGEAEFHVSSGLPPGMPPDVAAHYVQGWDMSGSLRAPKSHKKVWPWCKFENKISVPVCRLDTWAHEHGIGAIDFIWADVQGAEGDLIEGGRASLAKTRYFYTEYSNDEWYEGQPNLQRLAESLNNFIIIRRFAMDVLFKNIAREPVA